jgi:phosphopantothenoylcysteine decarboxylase / phosphopantothenate---cysteine ligase
MLRHKKIILGVCGSIAAYKAAFLIRLLVKQGAEVQVIMTASASEFISPLTLATLSKKPVLLDYFDRRSGQWNNHVELGLWADLMLIAPASANSIAKLANGLCDNLLSATYLSARCPVFVAPAMDLDMYRHPSTLANLTRLKQYGNHIIEAEHGELASGLEGQGRLAEPEHIVEHLNDFLGRTGRLTGKRVLLTAGPTHEPIDPVRFIGNHSSGKMGFALAQSLVAEGATVDLVCGPTLLTPPQHPQIKLHKVTTAKQMHEASIALFATTDIAIMAAAVADYTPAEVASQKIKKKENDMAIQLVKTVDIAKELGQQKRSNQFLVGFALETQNERDHALQKLESKNLDMIVLNSLNDAGAGFRHDTNKVTILDRYNNLQEFELKSKEAVAQDIVESIISKTYA